MQSKRIVCAALAGFVGVLTLGGCPGVAPTEFIAGGGGGNQTQIGDNASVTVLAPQNDLSITGGTPVEVIWTAVATTRSASIRIILDRDTNPSNGNETVVANNLPLNTTSTTINTTQLTAGNYLIGVLVIEASDIAASAYAGGQITVDQRPTLFFTSPRDNFSFDRTDRIVPTFDVAWSLDDPDSIVTVQILLDPDDAPNGNEILLRESNSQTGDSFSFDLPTSSFEAGLYRILALVGDGSTEIPFYAPGSIRLRSRLAGPIDLRNLNLPTGGVSGAIFEGFNPRDNAGSFVSSIRDIDGDGFSDFVILAQFGKPFYDVNVQRTGIGEAYLIYGRPDRFSGKLNLNSTGTTFRGDIFTGPPEQADPIRPSRGISSFALLSDWDGDGVREMAFGVPFTDSLSVDQIVDTDAPLDTNGYFRTGAVVIASGSSLRPDLGFPGRNIHNLAAFGTLEHMLDTTCGCTEGFHGPKAPTSTSVCVFNRHVPPDPPSPAPNAGSVRMGCRLSSNVFGDQFGETVSAWDFDSIIMSAPNRDPFFSIREVNVRGGSVPGGGVVSVFYCDVKDAFYPWTNTNTPPASAAFNYPGMIPMPTAEFLPHEGPFHYIIDDLVEYLAFNGPQQGSPGYQVDVTDGPPCMPTVDPHIETPDYSVRFWSDRPGAALSNAKSIDDFSADGLPDLLLGVPTIEEGAGACFIIFGRLRDLVRSGELKVEELGLPMDSSDAAGRRIFDGIRVVGGEGDRLGQSQDSAGDFNNDGIPDVVIGSPLVNNRRGGVAVFFGSREATNLTEREIPFDEIDDRGLGIILTGEEEGDLAGARVAGCGDIDGDGNDDILIAAPNRSIRLDVDLNGTIDIDRTNCGAVYLIYGSPRLRGTISLANIGTDTLPGAVFIGQESLDFLGGGLGEQGDRSFGIAGARDVDGDGVNDLLLSSVSSGPRDRARAGEVYLIYGTGD